MFSSSALSLPQQTGAASRRGLHHPTCQSLLPSCHYPRPICEPPSHKAANLLKNCVFLYVPCADEDICKLYCIAEDFDFFFAMSSKVKDGTPCSNSQRNVCIEGVCEVQYLSLSTDGVKMLNLISFHLNPHYIKEKAHNKC